ncbi:MAG: anti-phage protein KwaA [Eubacteriales bacterium]
MMNIGPVKLFLLSLWLLFLLLLIQTIDIPVCFEEGATFIGWGDLLYRNIFPFVLLFLILFDWVTLRKIRVKMNNSKKLAKQVKKVKLNNSKTIDFFTSTILPLAFLTLNSWRGYISIAIVIIALGVFFIKSNRIYSNPTLLIIGLNTYDIQLIDDTEIIALSFDILEKDIKIASTEIAKGYYFVKRKG